MADMSIPALPLWKFRSLADWERMRPEIGRLHADVVALQTALADADTVPGYSVTAEQGVAFRIGRNTRGEPNWRESLQCPVTRLNARIRAGYHAWRTERPGDADGRVYLTEGATAFHRYMSARHPGSVGSAYRPDVPRGEQGADGVRSEDLTRLTFADASFDALMTFEVLEHVPDYRAALRECARVLRPGGLAVITVPFVHQAQTVVRASLGPDGEVVHHLAPEYHGDPLDSQGILCFYHFGWSLLDDLREAGFSDACVAVYASRQFGYLGAMQLMILATR